MSQYERRLRRGRAADGEPRLRRTLRFGTSVLLLGLTSLVGDLLPRAALAQSSNLNTMEVLLKLYDQTNGLEWKDNTNWFTDQNVCDWFGIECFSDDPSDSTNYSDDEQRIGHVRSINLSENHLQNTVPSDVWDLPYLELLNLRDNPDVTLTFLHIGNALFLNSLVLSNTALTDLDGISGSRTLREIHVTDCNLGIDLPAEIYDMTQLRQIYFNYASFTGSLSSRIGNLKSLTHLYMYENDLTGTIPTQIGLLTNLQVLALSSNAFTGTLPSELDNLVNLEILAIQRSFGKEKGAGITGTLPTFENYRSIQEIYLENQRLSGEIPDNFLYYAPKQDGVMVNLMHNNLGGGVPGGLDAFDRLDMYLVGNEFTGIADELCDNGGWLDGDVEAAMKDGAGCDAIMCPAGTYSEAGRSTSDGSNPCVECSDDGAPFMGSTECESSDAAPDQRSILMEFYKATGGDDWSDNDGWGDEGVSECDWFGIECDDDDMVTTLDLQNQGLTGTLPAIVFTLPNLRKLNVMANDIDFIFKGISQATNLEYLWISNTGLTSTENIQELTQLVSLRELRMSQNKLSNQPIPKAVLSVPSLTYISLSHNAFTGTLPTEVGQLTSLTEFHAYACGLTGQIPDEIGNIGKGLTQLVLSENDFTGTLPTTLDQLTNLEELSIHQTTKSGPGIGGTLPALTGLKKLTALHLNSNSLGGLLPDDLLSNADSLGGEVSINLGNNRLTGKVPSGWKRFKELNVDLTGNKITAIGSGLCDMADWNGGNVATYGCDAILCPIGKYNEHGRQADSDGKCEACSLAQFMGSTECGSTADDQTERKVLEAIYYGTSGTEWDTSDGWLTEPDVCDWYGVQCNGYSMVQSLDLSENSLEGTIPRDVFQLTSLRELDLQNNDISFSFNGIESADSLETLYLSQTGLESIEGIGNAGKLKNFHSTNNKLNELPDEIFGISTLEKLFLNYNNIGGRLSSKLGNLKRLEEVFLMHNKLSGQIPASIGGLSNLRVLGLTENNFGGTLPEELNNLRSIEILAIQREGGADGQKTGGDDVGTNQGPSSKDGAGITGPLLSFNDLPNLKELYLGSNSLTGTIPYNLLDGTDDKDSRDLIVDVVSNELEGRVPSSLSQFGKLSIYLAGNKFEEIPSGLCGKDDWLEGDVDKYDCDAIMCPPNTFSKYGRQSSTDSACQDCPQGTNAPYFGSFECIGALAGDSMKERAILKTLYSALKGNQWTLSTNWLDSDEKICNWHGIQCVSDSIESVQGIRLPQNYLEGAVPSEVFDLPNLQELNLAGNKIDFSFDGISNAKSLLYLNLDGTGLSSLDGIQAASQLKLLHVVGNKLQGTFPDEIFSLSDLEVLYLSDNDIGGSLPTEMAKLTELVYLQCFACGLEQSIPAWLGSLPSLEYLRLDQNSLHGSIPSQIQSLTKIQHLDLSDQTSRGGPGLTGNLPIFANLLDMVELYLNKNNLEGDIPSDFLYGEYKNIELQVDLRENQITGSIPSSLSQLSKLSLFLAGNRISEIPPEICAMEFARGYGCSGVLCDVGTYNEMGRQTNDDNGCQSCSDLTSTQYYGSMQCGMNSQKDILQAFYSATGGADWEQDDGWVDAGASVCDYYGIACASGTDSVQSIVLDNNKLVGTIPTDIFQLPDLKEVKLKSNDVTFLYDGIENANNLERLHLSNTGATSIDGIGKAKGLKYLHLTSNNLGTVPDEIYDLTNLQDLFLNYNGLEGTLSTKIGRLTSLKNLFMFHNKITGAIPTHIGKLKNLKVLAFAENRMSGSLPKELNQLTKLEIIALQREEGETAPGIGAALEVKTPDEIGAGFTGPLLAFDNLPNLIELYLGSNSITGTIPSNLVSGVSDKSATMKIDLTMNNLIGTVPSSLSSFDAMKIYLGGNKIKEVPNSLCSKPDWMGGEVASNQCDAILCPPNTFNKYGRQANDETPCEQCPFTYNAEFYGSIECIPSNTGDYTEREVLRMFYQATGGTLWEDSTNWLKDGTSVCNWYGVTCSSDEGNGGSDTVTKVHLPSNKLSGTVPPVLFQLPNLSSLNVRDNNVDFEFEGIEMAQSLTELYLDATKTTSLDGIGGAKKLTTLHLQNNNFNGMVLPDELFKLGNLKYLYISDSAFGGPLPKGIENLVDLEEFYCHGNALTGTIPSQVGNLSGLKVLQLSENLFVGEIPNEFNYLTKLKSLFIDSFTTSSVGLSGPIPAFTKLKHLTELYLNANSLTGTVPADLLGGLSNKDAKIIVGLQSNQLTGSLPSELSRFSKMNIDVSGNMITRIDTELCILDNWQGGAVGQYNCDAILCPAGTYNEYGRQSSGKQPCVACDGEEQSPYMGSITCESEEKKREKEILELFYNTCGGRDWKNADNWMNDEVDICHWYGISCHEGRTIDSILLGGNNVVGTPPAKLFEMTGLKWLWLYSNPIDFKFDGIGKAKRLTSLLLDQTGLTSLKGVGAASALEDLDVRFNKLKGSLTEEINQLVSLKDFACEGNQLTGAVPSFSSLKKLERLRLGSNRFAGALEDYSINYSLKSLDLSDNIVSGPIPDTLLKNTDTSSEVFIDLSSNNLIGTVPGALARFEKLTLYLRDNMITGIDPVLCENENWNEGDIGQFSCDGLLCPVGTYSPDYGRATTGNQEAQCKECREAKYYGASYCGPRTQNSASSVRLGWMFIVALLAGMACVM